METTNTRPPNYGRHGIRSEMKKNNIIAFILEASGVIIATVSAGLVNLTAAGCVLAAGLISFGLAFEQGDN